MADKRIQDLTAATSVGATDLFVLEQSGQAKSLSGQTLMGDLADALDGHGGIADISYTAPVSPSLEGTLTITLADDTVYTLPVTNGNGITNVTYQIITNGTVTYRRYTLHFDNGTTFSFDVANGATLVEMTSVTSGNRTTYFLNMSDGSRPSFTVTNGRGIVSLDWAASGTPGDGQEHIGTFNYNDGTTSSFTIRDGYKGDTGDQTFVWFKWAENYPESDEDMQDNVGPYIGIYSGTSDTAPSTYTSYDWYRYKGEDGEPGATGDYIEPVDSFGTSTAAATEPSTWYSDPSSLSYAAGNFIWQKTEFILHTAQTVQATEKKIIGYIGRDGSGSGTVTQVTFNGDVFQDDGTGNVPMTVDAEDVGAIADPASKSNGQVLTYDSTAGEWVASTPSTGGVNTVNGKGVTSGTTNVQLYAGDIPMSSSDNTSVASAIPSASSTTPQKDASSGAVGTGTTWARADHKHPLNVPSSGTPADLGTASRGSASTYARSDHVHKMPSAADVGALPSTTTPADIGAASDSDIAYRMVIREGGTGTKTITFTSGANRGLLFASAGTAARNGLYIVHGGAGGTISCVPVLASSVLTFDTATTSQLKITNTSAVYIYMLWLGEGGTSNVTVS